MMKKKPTTWFGIYLQKPRRTHSLLRDARFEDRLQGDVDGYSVVGVIRRQILEVQKNGGVASDDLQHICQFTDRLVGGFHKIRAGEGLRRPKGVILQKDRQGRDR